MYLYSNIEFKQNQIFFVIFFCCGAGLFPPVLLSHSNIRAIGYSWNCFCLPPIDFGLNFDMRLEIKTSAALKVKPGERSRPPTQETEQTILPFIRPI